MKLKGCFFFTFKIESVTILQQLKRILISSEKGNIKKKKEKWKLGKYSIQKRATGTERNWGGSQLSQRKERRRREPDVAQADWWHRPRLVEAAARCVMTSPDMTDACSSIKLAGAKVKTLEFKDLSAKLNSVWLCILGKLIVCNIVKKISKRPPRWGWF